MVEPLSVIPYAFFEISSYKVYLGRPRPPYAPYSARILCRGDEDNRSLCIDFYSSETIPPNTCNADLSFARLMVPESQYSWYIDLLRNEKPIYAFIRSDHPEYNHISTSSEPVGEEESSD